MINDIMKNCCFFFEALSENVCSFLLLWQPLLTVIQNMIKPFNKNFHSQSKLFFVIVFSSSPLMAPRKKRTHLSQGQKYGGSPCELPDNDLPTYADVARCFYVVNEKTKDFKTQVKIVRENIMNAWKKCCPHLPHLLAAALYTKLVKFLTLVKEINKKRVKSSTFKYYEYKKEHLFDIAICRCDLPVVTCDTVNCASVNCWKVHIQCHCDAKRRVPEEERAYLRSQRTRGRKQMGQTRLDDARRMSILKTRRIKLSGSRLALHLDKMVFNLAIKVRIN